MTTTTTTTTTRVQELVTTLNSGIHTVVFTKSNGEERVLQGTLDKTIIGEDAREVVSGEDLVRVFEPSIKQWRSFHVSNVISVDGITLH